MPLASHEDTVLSVIDLDREECLELLGRSTIGRVVLSVDCIPVAVPVNLSLVDGDAVFATDVGSKLDAAIRGQVVSVEVDDVDGIYQTGWSVLLTGVAQVITDPEIIRRTRSSLRAWAPGNHPFLVKVPSTLISGRRLVWGAATTNPTPK
jgi:uncharacterized protein